MMSEKKLQLVYHLSFMSLKKTYFPSISSRVSFVGNEIFDRQI
jgi:hypothetical protein